MHLSCRGKPFDGLLSKIVKFFFIVYGVCLYVHLPVPFCFCEIKFVYTCAAGSGMSFQDHTDIELTMSEEEAAEVNELLDDAARSAVDRLDLRGGFYTDPTVTAGSWHHLSDADIDGT